MSDPDLKRCLVAVDAPHGPWVCALELPAGATIAVALAAARARLGDAVADWDAGLTGIWGLRQDRQVVPGAGDRIELYRPLPGDPRLRRRERARTRRR